MKDIADDVVESARKGNEEAFGMLLSFYQPFVINLLIRILKRKEVAEELCQEVWIKVFKSLSGFRKGSRFSTWLFSITHNMAIDFVSVKKNRMDQENNPEEQSENRAGNEKSPEINLSNSERKEIISVAIQRLPDSYRIPMIYFYYNDLGVGEIAKIMKCPEGTIKTALYRGRSVLRKLIPYGAIDR